MTEIELVLLPFVSAFAGGYIGAMLARAPNGKPRQFNSGYSVPQGRVMVTHTARVVTDTLPQSAAATDAVEFRLTTGSVRVTKRDVRRFVEMDAPTRAQLPPLVEVVEVKPDWVDEVPIPSRSVPVYRNGQRVGEVVLE